MHEKRVRRPRTAWALLIRASRCLAVPVTATSDVPRFLLAYKMLNGALSNICVMKGTLLEELMKIPSDAVAATVQGIEMQIIDESRAQSMLDADPDDDAIHECILSNGRFLFETEGHELKSLFKVRN